MVLCIHGFLSNVAAIQFGWRGSTQRSRWPFARLPYIMLNLPSWENLNLTVNFFSTKNTKFTVGCPALPCHMKTFVSPIRSLQRMKNLMRPPIMVCSNWIYTPEVQAVNLTLMSLLQWIEVVWIKNFRILHGASSERRKQNCRL